MKAKKRFYYEQVCARKNKSSAQGYDNMQGKRKISELYLQTNIDSQIVTDFKTQLKKGFYHIYVVCNRCLYKKSVISFKIEHYVDVNAVPFSLVVSYGGRSCICGTCDKTAKNCIPCQVVCNKLCQVVCNKLGITFLSKEFESIYGLERVLVSRRILFKKVAIMPKGKLSNIKGSLWNITINEVYDNCKSLPGWADSTGLLIVKSKHKAEYHSHVLFETVRHHCLLRVF